MLIYSLGSKLITVIIYFHRVTPSNGSTLSIAKEYRKGDCIALVEFGD